MLANTPFLATVLYRAFCILPRSWLDTADGAVARAWGRHARLPVSCRPDLRLFRDVYPIHYITLVIYSI